MFFFLLDDAPPTPSVHLGPITISIDQIKIGITSSLIVVPANLLIILLFKKAGPKIEKVPEEQVIEEQPERMKTPVSFSAIDLDEKSRKWCSFNAPKLENTCFYAQITAKNVDVIIDSNSKVIVF